MALAGIILDVIERSGGGGGGGSRVSWLSKAKASGLNKHMGWVLVLIAWRQLCRR